MAWALSQILVVSPTALPVSELTDALTTNYYDIFVRHAFGNYQSILKEVAYSVPMAQVLTYYGSRSTAYTWQNQHRIEYADENFAREIMQLFIIAWYVQTEKKMGHKFLVPTEIQSERIQMTISSNTLVLGLVLKHDHFVAISKPSGSKIVSTRLTHFCSCNSHSYSLP